MGIYDNFLVVNKLTKFITGLLILLLFLGCRTGMPPGTEQGEFQNIEHALLEGKWDLVMTYSEKLLTGEPDNVIVRYLLSIAYYMNRKYELQEEQYPWVLKDQQSMEAIVVWCENLVQRFPQNYYAHFVLGSAYPIRDEGGKAIETYKKAIEINPNLADAYVGVGTIYLDDEQIDEAIEYFKRAVEANPTYVVAYLNLGSAYEYNDQIDEAIASYEKTVEIDPKIVRAYISLGALYMGKGNRDKAIKAYQKVIELDPKGELGIYAREEIKKAQTDSDKDTPDTKEKNEP